MLTNFGQFILMFIKMALNYLGVLMAPIYPALNYWIITFGGNWSLNTSCNRNQKQFPCL